MFREDPALTIWFILHSSTKAISKLIWTLTIILLWQHSSLWLPVCVLCPVRMDKRHPTVSITWTTIMWRMTTPGSPCHLWHIRSSWPTLSHAYSAVLMACCWCSQYISSAIQVCLDKEMFLLEPCIMNFFLFPGGHGITLWLEHNFGKCFSRCIFLLLNHLLEHCFNHHEMIEILGSHDRISNMW